MFLANLYLFSLFLNITLCDWVSEWMSPVKDQLKDSSVHKNYDYDIAMFDSENIPLEAIADSAEQKSQIKNEREFRNGDLKRRLENTLRNAKILAEKLKVQINTIAASEKLLKEAIVSGRSGVSTVTVSSIGRNPRTYFIRDSFWSLCNGVIQFPVGTQQTSTYRLNEMFASPRCIGHVIFLHSTIQIYSKVSTEPDPCVFHSMIKYETVPQRRKLEYYEDDYLCLKPSFNNTLEQYLSVPRQIVNETCGNGIVRSLADNTQQCGVRVLAEYTYYPQKSFVSSTLPLEYCEEKDGSCKLIIAWHVSNSTIENFEFLRNEPNFKRYFIKPSESFGQVV